MFNSQGRTGKAHRSDFIWKLMRQMSIFLWKTKCRRQKKMDEKKKNKLGELSTKEIQEITDKAVPVTTKRP